MGRAGVTLATSTARSRRCDWAAARRRALLQPSLSSAATRRCATPLRALRSPRRARAWRALCPLHQDHRVAAAHRRLHLDQQLERALCPPIASCAARTAARGGRRRRRPPPPARPAIATFHLPSPRAVCRMRIRRAAPSRCAAPRRRSRRVPAASSMMSALFSTEVTRVNSRSPRHFFTTTAFGAWPHAPRQPEPSTLPPCAPWRAPQSQQHRSARTRTNPPGRRGSRRRPPRPRRACVVQSSAPSSSPRRRHRAAVTCVQRGATSRNSRRNLSDALSTRSTAGAPCGPSAPH